jgi:hypothetical protein
MDCQVVMAVFANLYYNAFVKLPVATVASLLQTVRRNRSCKFSRVFGVAAEGRRRAEGCR